MLLLKEKHIFALHNRGENSEEYTLHDISVEFDVIEDAGLTKVPSNLELLC